MSFKVGDRVTTDDDPLHGASILSIDQYGIATIQFDQRGEYPYPPDEVDVGDLRRFPLQTLDEATAWLERQHERRMQR